MPIEDLLTAFQKIKVLVVGDVMIDRYLSGTVDRISPEAPVPIVHLRDEDNRLGGAANVALNIHALGATPYLVSYTGKDANGELFLKLMEEARLPLSGILGSNHRCTTVKTRVLAQHQQLMRVDREDTHDITGAEAGDLLNRVNDLIEVEQIDVLLLQDYNKGVLTEKLIPGLIERSRKAGIPVVVDPKARNFWAYRGVTVFKPNLREMQQQADFPLTADRSGLDTADALLRRQLDHQYTMITLSDKGIYLHDGERGRILPTRRRSIADVSGAGDTVISVVALGIALGISLDEIGLLANLAGGQVVEKPGVVPVDLPQLKREYSELAL